MSDKPALVPLSHALVAGTVGQNQKNGDMGGTGAGTTSLKALAAKVLHRDTHWDKAGTTAPNSCPTASEPVGQTFEPVPPVPHGLHNKPTVADVDDPEERAAIVEHDGNVPRTWAEGFA